MYECYMNLFGYGCGYGCICDTLCMMFKSTTNGAASTLHTKPPTKVINVICSQYIHDCHLVRYSCRARDNVSVIVYMAMPKPRVSVVTRKLASGEGAVMFIL